MTHNIYIFDIEVFKHDWIVIFRNIESDRHMIIHNNNYQLKEFLNQPGVVIGGFNNKSYDDWILMTMIGGGDNAKVKEHNDFIIGGGNGWEFPFIQFQKRPFKSFDLRDDLQDNLSLKAIEGNIGSNIKETEVDFNLDRPLTPNELKLTIKYCTSDVDNTLKLYELRQNYLNSKKQVARIKGMDEIEALSLTNAKLTARFLDAKHKTYDDEFNYILPECLELNKYNQVLEFFKDPVNYTIADLENRLTSETRKIKIKSLMTKIEKIKKGGQYKTNLEIMIAGVPHTYGWGGVHGARKNFVIYEDPDHTIVDIDVGSYYPSMMLVFDYISRSIPSKVGYKEVYDTRIKAKHSGDSATANALKLVLNTCYGAMKNKYNDLYDPHNANQICITGQLLLTDIIEKLETVPSFELIQSNTDGIILRYANSDEKLIEAAVTAWEQKTGLNMEYTIIHSYIAKDVNNYLIKQGGTYLVAADGSRTYTKKDKGNIETRGGYVSKYEGGDFENNSMIVIQKALVNYFLDHTPVEDTINATTNVSEFQIIAKTGSSYNGTYWEVDGEKVKVQRVNRVYATQNKKYGTIYKLKGDTYSIEDITESDDSGKSDKIASLPEHCIIDNENIITLDKVDKQFYIDLAHKRVSDYIGNQPIIKNKEVIKTMAETKSATKKNIYQKILEARVSFLKSGCKKSGVNRFAEFKYFELSDIVPVATEICNQVGLIAMATFTEDIAQLTVVDVDDPEIKVLFHSPMRKLAYEGIKGMNAIQGLGSEETYQRRYLYMLFLDIVENDTIDATSGSDKAKASDQKAATKPADTKVTTKPADTKPADTKPVDTKSDDTTTGKEGIAYDLAITEKTRKALIAKLKELRAKELKPGEEDYEAFIQACKNKIKAGLTEADGQAMMLLIDKRIEK